MPNPNDEDSGTPAPQNAAEAQALSDSIQEEIAADRDSSGDD